MQRSEALRNGDVPAVEVGDDAEAENERLKKERSRAKHKARSSAWYASNQERIRARYASNQEQERAKARARRDANLEKERAHSRNSARQARAANPEKHRTMQREFRAARRAAGLCLDCLLPAALGGRCEAHANRNAELRRLSRAKKKAAAK